MTTTSLPEVWKKVKGYEDLYDVSSLGRIWSRTRPNTLGYIRQGRFRKFRVNLYGYCQLLLCDLDGVRKTFLVHRLVAAAFIGSCPKSKEVNHKNGVKTDNRVTNLEYVTHAKNTQHAYDNGLIDHYKGEGHWKAELNVGIVRIIRRLHKEMSFPEIGRVFNTTTQNVYMICSGKNWKHVTHPDYAGMTARNEPLTFQPSEQ